MGVARTSIALFAAAALGSGLAAADDEPSGGAPGDAARSDGKGPPPSPGKHCLERDSARWFSEQTLVVQAAPSGAELEAKAGACWPLIRDRGELFDYSHVLVGLDVQGTAGYVQVGPYLEILPLSVLGFRAELHRVEYFPAGLSGAGYFARQSYDSSFRTQDLPADEARSASGLNWVIASWLQLTVELGGPLSVFVWDEAALEHWSLGDSPYYYNVRWDLLLASSDELLRNDFYAGASVALGPELALGVGPASALRRVPAGEYTAHVLGAAINSSWRPRSSALRSLDTFLAAGGFLQHSFRNGVFVSFVLTARWDLGSL